MKISIALVFLMAGGIMINGCSTDSLDMETKPSGDAGNGGFGQNPPPVSIDSTTAIYRQFFFRGTHNSYSGNLAGMQREGIATQLERGLRFFEFDLFTFHSALELQTDWPEAEAQLFVFTYGGQPMIISYSSSDEMSKLYRLDESDIQLIDEFKAAGTGQDREFKLVSNQGNFYLFELSMPDGELVIHSFDGTSLETMATENIGPDATGLDVFVLEGHNYLGVEMNDVHSYQIMEWNFEEGNLVLGTPLYEVLDVSPGESIDPFVQNGTLHIFRHNPNTTTNYSVEILNTGTAPWSLEASVPGTSDLLLGQVNVVQSQDDFFVNSYMTNGQVIGSKLLMDKGIPNLIYEFNNEVAMLAGANSQVSMFDNGYLLLLQNEQRLQLSSITIGSLVLGHDAPGDEVDFEVDNPESIFLRDWISYIAQWSDQNPGHEPLFIMTELKEYEQWISGRKWEGIIRLMQDYFGDRLRFHSSSGFHNETLVGKDKIIDGRTGYFMDESGSEQGGMLGKVVLYIQPNINITRSEQTNNFSPFATGNGFLQESFLQLKRYREENKLVSPDWRKPTNYGNDIGAYIDGRDDSYISRIFHMESSDGDGQYDNIRCTDVMFAVSDRPFDGLYVNYAREQQAKNKLEPITGCD